MSTATVTAQIQKQEHRAHVKRLREWLKKQRKLKRPLGLQLTKRSKDGIWTFWKVTTSDFCSPYRGLVSYIPGQQPQMLKRDCDSSPNLSCAEGLHLWPFLPTMSFAQDWSYRPRVVQVEVQEKDIVAVPFEWGHGHELKLRVCRMKVIKEVFPKKIQAAQLKKAATNGTK